MGHLELQSLTGNATLLSTRHATVGDWPRLSFSSPNLVPNILPGICLCVSSNSSSPYQRGFPGRLILPPPTGLTESGADQGPRGLLELQVQPHHCTDGETEAQRGRRISPGPTGNPWGGAGWMSICNKDPQVAHTVLSIVQLVIFKQPFR